MRFIKKLVILTGGGARGTLMLEKNNFGVWCKLNIFDLRQKGDFRLVIISGDDLFLINVSGNSVSFDLGEINFEEIHVALISDRVIMYGSNCATKIPHDVIMHRLKRYEQKQQNFITFSGREKKIEDYFKQIVPPQYNDFAIAEKNYYPAYVTASDDWIRTQDDAATVHISVSEKENTYDEKHINSKLSNGNPDALEVAMEAKKPMPYELELRYLHLIEATTTVKEKTEDAEKIQKAQGKTFDRKTKGTEAEKPEVIAMARRITLRDYRVENAKKTGRRATFFERSSVQIEKLMTNNERFSAMENLIPGSKFVKINYDSKRYYIVGVIGHDYICYGVPSVYSEVPPEPLAGYAKWLPFDVGNPHGEGFWMMYQDGISGETIKN